MGIRLFSDFAILRNFRLVGVMASVTIHLFREKDGEVPFFEWFESLPRKAQKKCRVRLARLHEMGNELRRPEADYLRDAIYELRVGFQRLNCRILYFFHGRSAVVLSHGLQKEKTVPSKEIELAIERRKRFVSDPEKHTSTKEIP
jgi:phage-related protein